MLDRCHTRISLLQLVLVIGDKVLGPGDRKHHAIDFFRQMRDDFELFMQIGARPRLVLDSLRQLFNLSVQRLELLMRDGLAVDLRVDILDDLEYLADLNALPHL